jgi:hypothetical protein
MKEFVLSFRRAKAHPRNKVESHLAFRSYAAVLHDEQLFGRNLRLTSTQRDGDWRQFRLI